jgi:hypothetical protein
MAVITGIEWARGEAVGGNGKGTTIGQVVNDQSSPQKPTAPPPGPASETSEPPTETSEPPATSTSPNSSVEQSPTMTTPARPTPSETTLPPLVPPLPRIGD